MRSLLRAGALALALPLVLTGLAGCSGGDEPSGSSTSSSTTTASPTGSPAPAPTRATAAPRPADRACYALSFDAAVAPTSDAPPVACTRPHTSMTFAVGTLDTVVDGHLLAVDSARVQAQPARECPRLLARFLGGSADDLHLSMFRSVWFTPSVEESDAGADFYRCDVIAVARENRLAPLTGRLAGVLSRPAARAAYGMCGTAEPGTRSFARVICSAPHSWRAIRTVDLAGRRYPGEARVRAAGQETCKDAGRAVASDTLDFQWGYEWPTAKQWADGQHHGLCWAPD